MEKRISIPVPDALAARLQKALPWGTQAAVLRRVIELTLDQIEQNGYNTIQLLISGHFNPLEDFQKSCAKQKGDKK